MFSTEERGALRQRLIEHARLDAQVTGCAILGSAARNDEDAWSDIDIAVQIADDVAVEDIATRWSAWLRDTVGVADCLDIHAFGALYRVFLLHNSLQVDVSFWPHEMFRPVGGPLQLVFGEVNAPEPSGVHDPVAFIRMGWLYALHARSAVARGRSWQADMMLTDLRNQIIALACVRHGLNPTHGRQAHELPEEIFAELLASRAAALDMAEQRRSLRATIELYRIEVAQHDQEIATSLAGALDALAASVGVSPGS